MDNWRRVVRVVEIAGAVAMVFLAAVVVIALFSGDPGHDEIVEQLTRIEARLDQLE
jgi:hypothetical protein